MVARIGALWSFENGQNKFSFRPATWGNGGYNSRLIRLLGRLCTGDVKVFTFDEKVAQEQALSTFVFKYVPYKCIILSVLELQMTTLFGCSHRAVKNLC